jgi:uncharacterized protein YuzE
MPLTEKELLERDAKRDIGAELLQSAREINAGLGKVAYRIKAPHATKPDAIRVSYDKSTHSLYLHLAGRASVDSDEVASGIVVDCDADGAVVGIDIQHGAPCTYLEKDDVLQIQLSDKPVVRTVSPNWHVNLSYADDGSLAAIELLDAKQLGLPPQYFGNTA